MRAIVRKAGAGGAGMEFVEVPEPVAGPGEALVDVRVASVNFGGVAYLDGVADGTVRGVDGVGVVRSAPESSLSPGCRVAFATPHGAWAERTVVPVENLAPVPDAVSDADAAALPGAGLTALQAVRAFGDLTGRTVLVTGAAGGVGGYAVQLAKGAGARVIALVSSEARQQQAQALGADRAVTTLERLGERANGVIDVVGGPVLGRALGVVAPGALVLNVGYASREPTTIDFEQLRRTASGARVEAFVCTDVGGESLTHLLGLVAVGRLRSNVRREVSWEEYATVVDAMLDGALTGKAVLRVT